MEQRFVVDKDLDAGTLTIKEMAETDVSKFTVLHQESFPLSAVEEALSEGQESLIALFRNHNFFPPRFSAETLAEGILSMFGEEEKTTLKITFCDSDSLSSHNLSPEDALITGEKELVEIDKLLEDDDTVDPDIEA